MLAFIGSLLLLIVLLLAVSAQKTYAYVPLKELKRQARQGDPLAMALYQAASYGLSLRLALWIIIGLTAAGSFVLLQQAMSGWLTFFFILAIIWFGFVWLPATQLTRWGARTVAAITPALARLLAVIHPALQRLTRLSQHQSQAHTGLYEREDLIELLQNQAAQTDSRIAIGDLQLAEHALQFGDVRVREVMTPQRMVKSIMADESIGPVLLDDLHRSGFSRFPVSDPTSESAAVIGTLYLRQAVRAKHGESVAKVMSHDVYYVHEDYTLRQVLQAFLRVKHHLFIVVNEFEERVGIITIEDVVEQILGQSIVDEFDQYDDLRAVAASRAAQERADHQPADSQALPETDETVVE